MIRRLYSLLLWLAQPLLLWKLRRRAQAEPLYGFAVPERFGHYTQPADKGRVWIHAVSLGETRAAGVLLGALREQYPGMRLLLTHGTATGRLAGQSLLRPGDVQVWQPWDTPAAVQRFLAHFQPRLGVLIETELWPNLAAQCARREVPLVLVNARLSQSSARGAQRLAWLARPAYAALQGVWAQTEEDAKRLRHLGAPVSGVTGNLKYDAAPNAQQLTLAQRWRAGHKPVVMLASSREGEEHLWLQALVAHPTARQWQWLVVPRHPQRFDEVAQLLADAGLTVARRSAWTEAPPDADVWLGDSLGEMALYYGLSDLALLGGSFAPLGGQNLIEALQAGCPVLMGPHTFNFAQPATAALHRGVAFQAENMVAALQQSEDLLGDRVRLAGMRAHALAFGGEHQGAARRTARALAPWLG